MNNIDSILRLPDVIKATGLRRSAIYEAVRSGDFPRSVKLTARARGWLASDIMTWIGSRERAQRRAAR